MKCWNTMHGSEAWPEAAFWVQAPEDTTVYLASCMQCMMTAMNLGAEVKRMGGAS